MCTIIGYKSLKVNKESIHQALLATYTRGPDDERIQEVGCGYLGFQRLSIMGLSPLGMQPFVRDDNYVVCNGEIYGFRKIKSELEKSGYTFISQSDCEILLPLYEKYGLDMFKKLDAEYACIIYDAKKNDFIAGDNRQECRRGLKPHAAKPPRHPLNGGSRGSNGKGSSSGG